MTATTARAAGARVAPGGVADAAVAVVTGVMVVGLAGVAGAISYSHMVELALAYGETRLWRAHMFPLAVDGVEIVASLVLLAERRMGRRVAERPPGFGEAVTRWLPWFALGLGTAASLAANVAVGGDSPVAKAVAGWPALALLLAVKMFFGLLDRAPQADSRDAAAGRAPTVGGEPIGDNDRSEGGMEVEEAAPAPAVPRTRPARALPARRGRARAEAVPDLLPVARAAAAALRSAGRR